MGRSDLAVVIPCHNEAATLDAVAARAGWFGDVLVIDDRSTDASRTVAEAAGAEVIAARAPGYDGAVDTGLREAFARGYRYVVTLDADGEHDPALVGAFRTRLGAGAELVCGYRPAPQRAAEYVAAAMGRALYGVRDLLCGMKGYGRPVLQTYAEAGAPLLVNMAPAVLWRKSGGAVCNLAVTGERRTGRPRFGRALAANLVILRATGQAIRLQPPSSPPAAASPVREAMR